MYQVLVWTDIAQGDSDYCAVIVAFNSILQIILYAPFGILYVTVIAPHSGQAQDFNISYTTVARSVAAFLGKLNLSNISSLIIELSYCYDVMLHFVKTKL